MSEFNCTPASNSATLRLDALLIGASHGYGKALASWVEESPILLPTCPDYDVADTLAMIRAGGQEFEFISAGA